MQLIWKKKYCLTVTKRKISFQARGSRSCAKKVRLKFSVTISQCPQFKKEDKEAGASLCFHKVHIMNRTRWLDVRLVEDKKERVFHLSLASVVKITCTSTSPVKRFPHSVQIAS